jgi:hypothetical protein
MLQCESMRVADKMKNCISEQMVDALDTFGFVLDQPQLGGSCFSHHLDAGEQSNRVDCVRVPIPTSGCDFEAFVDAEPAGAEVCHALFLLNPFRRRRVHVHPLVPQHRSCRLIFHGVGDIDGAEVEALDAEQEALP